jgi:hypothetical protein
MFNSTNRKFSSHACECVSLFLCICVRVCLCVSVCLCLQGWYRQSRGTGRVGLLVVADSGGSRNLLSGGVRIFSQIKWRPFFDMKNLVADFLGGGEFVSPLAPFYFSPSKNSFLLPAPPLPPTTPHLVPFLNSAFAARPLKSILIDLLF